MSRRSRFLKLHPELTALPSAISDTKVQGRNKFDKQKVNAFHVFAQADRFPKRMYIFYRFNERDVYTVMPMNEDASTDIPSGAKAFTATIEAKSADAVLDYYLLAENAGSVSFLPAEYTKKPFKVNLSDLNK
jgi:hypothetical protein